MDQLNFIDENILVRSLTSLTKPLTAFLNKSGTHIAIPEESAPTTSFVALVEYRVASQKTQARA